MRLAKVDPVEVRLTDLKKAMDILKPVACPYQLIRIGGNNDGAYLLPDDLDGIAGCFSPGVNNFKDFEDELEDKYEISSYMCDFSSDVEKFRTPLKEGKQFFLKKWLDVDGSNDSISLEKWVMENCPDPDDDLILQMDIERAEYRNIQGTPSTILERFRIIVIEIHSLNRIRDHDFFYNQLQPSLSKLSKHFVCVHARPNNVAPDIFISELGLNLPSLMELTFLRKDRITRSNSRPISPMLPHPNDIRRNVKSKPPLFLNEKWSSGERHAVSAQKMVDDLFDYIDFQQKSHDATIAKINRTMHAGCLALYRQLFASSASYSHSSDLHNLSDGKPYWLSKSYGNFPKTGFVQEKSPFFFHTGFEYNSFITIDLGKSYKICEILLRNRTDNCRERASTLFFKLHQQPSHIDAPPMPLSIDSDFITLSNTESRTLVPNLSARFVTLIAFTNTAIHLSSITILGKQEEA